MGKNPKSATDGFVPLGEDKLSRMAVQLRRTNRVSSAAGSCSGHSTRCTRGTGQGSGRRAQALAAPSLPRLPSTRVGTGGVLSQVPPTPAGEGRCCFLHH